MMKLGCADCTTPVAEVDGDAILIRSRHHGAVHVTRIVFAQVVGRVTPVVDRSFPIPR